MFGALFKGFNPIMIFKVLEMNKPNRSPGLSEVWKFYVY